VAHVKAEHRGFPAEPESGKRMRRRQSESFFDESLEKRATIELDALPLDELRRRARETVEALMKMVLAKPPA